MTPLAPASPRAFPVQQVGRDTYIRLSDMARVYGLTYSTASKDTLVLSSRYHSMLFEPDSQRMTLMDVMIWLQRPVKGIRGHWSVHQSDTQGLIDPILRPYLHLRNRDASVVVLDAGHGGHDGGAESVFPGLVEKDLALDVASRVRMLLVRAGVRVMMTREDDRFIELEDRSRMAASWSPDIFVSIHCNAAAQSDANGVETYILSKSGGASTNTRDQSPSTGYRPLPGNMHDAASAVLGYSIQRRLVRDTQMADRGLRHARFAVLKNSPCAAALVECGFLSNTSEARRLADPAHRDRIARAIAQGILEYGVAVRKAQISR